MAVYFLLVTCLVGFAFATIPSYIKVCNRNDPDLDKCVIKSIETIRSKLAEGIPELDVPKLEPLHMSQIVLANSSSFKAVAQKVEFYDFTQFKIDSLAIDLEKGTISVIVCFDKIRLNAEYAVNTKVGPAVIAGTGPINIIAKGVKAVVELKLKRVTRKGRESIFFSSMTTKLAIDDYKSEFTPREGDDVLAAGINSALQSNKEEVMEEVIPNIESTICEVVLDSANKICKHFYYDELLPVD